MIQRKSIINQIEVPTHGGVAVRIALQIVDGDTVISSKWHRTLIPVGISPAEQLAFVNEHLAMMGEAPISSADIQRVGLFHKLATDLPSEHAPAKTIDDTVAEINAATVSRVVDAT
jgi:hypothetical protein